MSGDTSPVAAEHARLVAEAAQAGARLKDLQAHRPDRSDEQACTAHKALEDAAGGAAFDAGEAADCYLRQHPDLVPVYGAARRWQALGVSTIAIKSGGSKAPVGKWKQYQGVLPAEDELWRLHHSGHYGLAVLTGLRDSDDGLFAEMLEHEGRSIDEGIFGQFLGELAKEGLSECWQRITDGYWEMSPSGGLHFFWLTEDVCGNTKLAQRPATAEELAAKPEEKVKVLIETRGRGGYVVAAPTPGGFHKSGRPWRAMGGPPESIATITAEEREKIFACARKFHTAGPIHSRRERAKHETLAKPAKGKTGEKAEGKAEDKPATRPGDIFNQRGPDWAELLEPHGWRLHKTDADGTINWTRPGKAGGPSATTGNPRHEDNKLHVFTSSTEFEPDESYSKFAAYVILNHGGDWSAAAAQLARDGYVPGKAAAEKTAAGSDADGEITEITDAHFAERFAAEVLRDGYCWVTGFGGWMAYREARRKERRGARWFRTTDKSMTNLARTWLIREYEAFKDGDPEAGAAVKKSGRSSSRDITSGRSSR